MSKKVAIYGGRFDPFHDGHLAIIIATLDKLPIDKLLLVPAGNPQHQEVVASYQDRLTMCQLATKEIDRCEVSDIEKDDKHSYSIKTVKRLINPTDTNIFITGIDAFSNLHTWHQWEDLYKKVNWLVFPRYPKSDLDHVNPVYQVIKDNIVDDFKLLDNSGSKVFFWHETVHDINAREIIFEIKVNNVNWHKDIPQVVADYIDANNLYRK